MNTENILSGQFLQLRECMHSLFESKNKGQIEFNSTSGLSFVALKHSNRKVKRNIKSGRDELHLQKTKIDVYRLQLQNLLYEISHLKKEISLCRKFKSRDTHIELLSDEEYENKCFITIKNSSDMSEHKMHLNRLQSELKLRKKLDNLFSTLLETKQELLEDNLNKTQRQISFAPALRTLLASTKPLHDTLQLSLDVEWKNNLIIKYLPRALYILFVNLQFLKCLNSDFKISSEVVGLEHELKTQNLLFETTNVTTRIGLPDERRNKETNTIERHLRRHPLHIRIQIVNSDKSCQLELLIHYWELIKCATIQAQLNDLYASYFQCDVHLVQELLSHLFSDDFGNYIPIPGIEYELQHLNLNIKDCFEFLLQNHFGKPYCWLQSMCSIATAKKMYFNHELNLNKYIHIVITRILRRLQYWITLFQQIQGLTYKDIDMCTLMENIYPEALFCSLLQWTAIPYVDINSEIKSKMSLNGITYLSYRAVLIRGSAKMECFIRIPSNYPLGIPLWTLNVHWNGRHTATNNTSIKMMEFWTNNLLPTHLPNNNRLLYSQLFRTIYSFDIFLETESVMQSTKEYNKEKPYVTTFTKRIRLRPFKYMKKGSYHIFRQ